MINRIVHRNVPRDAALRLALLPALLVACADPLVDPEVVVGLRVVGAKVSSSAEPEKAELAPGESGSIEWWVVADKPLDYEARVVWCLGKETSIGLQECQERPFLETVSSGDTTAPLRLDFELPRSEGAEHWLAWIGVCESAAPRFDWRTRSFDCERGQALESVYEGPFARTGQPPNRNPELADDRLLRGTEAWPALERGVVPAQACAGEDLPRVRAGQTLHLHWRRGGDDREALETGGDYAAPERESLVFTHLATEPGLERAFSAIDWDSDKRGFDLDFTLPETPRPPAQGRSIGLYLIVRDERGGTAFEGRELCALP